MARFSSTELCVGACGIAIAVTRVIGCSEYDESLLRYTDAGLDASIEASVPDGGDAAPEAAPEADAPPEVSLDVLTEEAAPSCSATIVDCDGDEGNGCETDLTSSVSSCGACGHGCLDGACKEGKCQPFVLASGQSTPTNVALDDTHLYWTNQVPGGAIMRVPRLGGAAEIVAAKTKIPGGLAVDGSSVFWSEFESGGSIWRLDMIDVGDASKAVELHTGQATSLTLIAEGTRVFWVTPGTVRSVLKAGGGYLQLADGQGTPAGLVAGFGLVFWTNAVAGTVVGTNLSDLDAGITTLASDQSYPVGLAADISNLYWANNMAGADGGLPRIMAVSRTASVAPKVLADDQAGPIGVAQRGTYVYWTNNVGGSVMRVLKTGGAPETLASGQQAPGGIAVDSTAVYWVNRDDGNVMALAL